MATARHISWLAVLVGAALLGCSKSDGVKTYEVSNEPAEADSTAQSSGGAAMVHPMGTSIPTPPEPAVAGDDHMMVLAAHRMMKVPETWERKTPRSTMIAYEYAVPAAEGDSEPGRMTMMAAMGSIADNIERWEGQFKQPDGSPTEANVEEIEVDGCPVHLVDVAGNYNATMPGMMMSMPPKENYRMLAAIIVADGTQFFVKFTGPAGTVDAGADAFRAMIESLGK